MALERGDMWVEAHILGQYITLRTCKGIFSPAHIDRGTLAMLTQVDILPGMHIMDLGCGCGVVGIVAAKIAGEENVLLSDVDPVAVQLARENAQRNGVGGVRLIVSDGFKNIDETGFDLILSNPPYQTDFSVAKGFIEKGFNRLKLGGKLVMVTKRREWYRNKLTRVFGGVTIAEADGYCVFSAQRRSLRYANKPLKGQASHIS